MTREDYIYILGNYMIMTPPHVQQNEERYETKENSMTSERRLRDLDERRSSRSLSEKNSTMTGERLLRQVLSKRISQHVMCRTIIDLNNTVSNAFAKRHDTKVNVA